MKDKIKIVSITQPDHVTVDEKISMTTVAWQCVWRRKNQTRILSVPINYQWDGASIPRFAWSIMGLTPSGILDAPSLAHDILYRSAGGRKNMNGCALTNKNDNGIFVDREEADWLFYEIMKFFKISGVRDEIAYGVVRAFGWRFWGRAAPTR